MLPESKKHKVNSGKTKDVNHSLSTNDYSLVYQFADTSLPTLLEEMRKLGSSRQNIVARIAGGAKMFTSYANAGSGIGDQNIRSVRQLLEQYGIPLKGRDTGGSHGRSVEFHLETGRVVVKTFEKEDREI